MWNSQCRVKCLLLLSELAPGQSTVDIMILQTHPTYKSLVTESQIWENVLDLLDNSYIKKVPYSTAI